MCLLVYITLYTIKQPNTQLLTLLHLSSSHSRLQLNPLGFVLLGQSLASLLQLVFAALFEFLLYTIISHQIKNKALFRNTSVCTKTLGPFPELTSTEFNLMSRV